MRIVSRVLSTALLLLATSMTAARAADVNQLIKDVSSDDKAKCLSAIGDLEDLGPDAKPAVGALGKALSHDDAEVRWRAARALGAIGPDAKAAVGPLTKALSDKDAEVRAYAAFALGRMGNAAVSAADALIKNAFDKENPKVRRAAVRALIMIDPPEEKVRPLIQDILEKKDLSVIVPAIYTLAQEGKKAVPRLRTALKHEEACYWACIALGEIGPDSKEAVPEIAEHALKHKDPDVRLQALIALGQIGEGSKPAVPDVLKLLNNDPFPLVRYAAAYALGTIKAKGAGEDALRKGMQSDDEFLRTVSAWGLARINPDDKEIVRGAVKLIVAAFKSKNPDVRAAAARAVIEFEGERDIVAPALVEALDDQDPAVVANAIEALAKFGPKALDHVDDALKNKGLRFYAVQLIARIGPEADKTLPALLQALKQKTTNEEDRAFKSEVQLALASIGPIAGKDKQIVQELLKSLESKDDKIRASASYALGKIKARVAIFVLRKKLQTEKSDLAKLSIVLALVEMQPDELSLGIVAPPILIRALDSEYEMIRAQSAFALGRLGRKNDIIISRLKKLQTDESLLVREAAKEALDMLGT